MNSLAPSSQELTVMEFLYRDYRKRKQNTKKKTSDIFRELNICNGQDVSTLNDSKYFKKSLDSTYETFQLSEAGIRYMDNLYSIILHRYEDLGGAIKNGEMVNRDKFSRAYKWAQSNINTTAENTKPINRERWSTDHIPDGYPQECNTDQLKNVIQDLNDEYVMKKKGGKHNKIWEDIILQQIKSGNEELKQRRQSNREHVEDKTEKFSIKDLPLWLKYTVAIVTILGVVWAIVWGIFTYVGQQVNGVNTSQTNQQHLGNGDNVAGDKNIYNGSTASDITTDKKVLYEGNIFNLSLEAENLKTSIEKENYFKKFVGLLVNTNGYITDIYDPGNNTFGGIAGIYYQVRIDDTEHKDTPYIMCAFDASWGKKLESLNVPFETEFTATIDNVQPGSRVWLYNCVLK
ncbi:hypothetical protein C4569_01980 [Candidatus Parcubacteria bacterium]|nr:MAG: hypothetical protein C4569_01980 [Candidatus Parcubacteria bacterium]